MIDHALAAARALQEGGGGEAGAATGPLSLAFLAVVQGLTEFLPVSSSGHLVLAQEALGVRQPGVALEVALHVGTLAAVVAVYRASLRDLVRDLFAGRPREVLLIAAASVPTGLLGVFLKDRFEAAFGDPRQAAVGLLVTAAVLVVGDRVRRRAAADAVAPGGAERPRLGLLAALVIGTVQGCAIWPGVSRSGSTIAAGLVLGLKPAEAARFSFLASIPAILGAALLKLLDASGAEGGPGAMPLVGAALLAALVGWASLRALLAFLGRGAFAWFAVYTGLLGAGYLVLA